MADFFDGEASRAQFKRKIQWYGARYGDQPIVYGWELWNEINAVSGDGDYMAWTETMLPELHKTFLPHSLPGPLEPARSGTGTATWLPTTSGSSSGGFMKFYMGWTRRRKLLSLPC